MKKSFQVMCILLALAGCSGPCWKVGYTHMNGLGNGLAGALACENYERMCGESRDRSHDTPERQDWCARARPAS